MIKNILSIAGSDPSGGAGVQADLKTFSALGCYGMAAVTALTAQNTKGVTAVYELPPAFVAKQVNAIFDDIRVDAVKIGMAGNAETIKAIARILKKRKPKIVILDPVMLAQSGDRLISDKAVAAMKEYLMPLADIITPNLPEAGVLFSQFPPPSPQPSPQWGEGVAAELRRVRGGNWKLLLKGGHGTGSYSDDIYIDQKRTIVLKGRRIKTKNNHGTGCTLSSAIACYMAQGMSAPDACAAAKKYVANALRHSDKLTVGKGHGPTHHFWDL